MRHFGHREAEENDLGGSAPCGESGTDRSAAPNAFSELETRLPVQSQHAPHGSTSRNENLCTLRTTIPCKQRAGHPAMIQGNDRLSNLNHLSLHVPSAPKRWRLFGCTSHAVTLFGVMRSPLVQMTPSGGGCAISTTCVGSARNGVRALSVREYRVSFGGPRRGRSQRWPARGSRDGSCNWFQKEIRVGPQ